MTTAVVPDSIEELDFDHHPVCEVSSTIDGPIHGVPAQWLGIKPCCSAHSYSCDYHRHHMNKIRMCKACGAFHPSMDVYKWVKL